MQILRCRLKPKKRKAKKQKIKKPQKGPEYLCVAVKKSLVLVISYAVVINNQFKHIFPKKGDYAKSLLKKRQQNLPPKSRKTKKFFRAT